MNILVMGINYAPEPTGVGPHTTALCEYLAKRGHSVTVVTGFPFAPHWARWPEYRGRLIIHECLHAVEVWRVTNFIPNDPGRMTQRVLMEGSFCVAAALVTLIQLRSRWDIILYVGAQPSIAMLVRVIAGLKRVPYIIKVTDLAAQAAKDVGIVKSRWLLNLLATFEYMAYQQASGAIVLCAGFKDALVAKCYPPDRIRIIYDSVDLELVRPLDGDNDFRSINELSPDNFVVLYSGSMGLKQGLTNVVEAARLLYGKQPDVKWVLVGDGELRSAVERQVADYKLGQYVRLLPLQPETRMSAMFSAADVLLLNQVSNVKDAAIPSKLLTYMAAGRPVLAAVNPGSQAAALLRESGGGLIVPPEDPAALAAGVKQLQADPAGRQEMGRRNRAYAEQHFDRRKIVAAQEAFLLEIAGQTRIKSRQKARNT
jgi:colanic acid biosynthesis glycosyl transferase WcaI